MTDEFIEVVKRDKFKQYFNYDDIAKLLELFDAYGEIAEVTINVKACRDLKDNFLLSLSIDCQADYLVTGDRDLLELKSFGKTKIVSISDFTMIL